jgi:hypothetical protein
VPTVDERQQQAAEQSVAARYGKASEEARRVVDEILAADADDQAWIEQLGPAVRGTTVAEMLGVSPQAVSSNKGLLRLTMRSGRVGYPLFQFNGDIQIEGLAEVVRTLRPVVATEWTIASWLTSPNVDLGGDAPLDVLRGGRSSSSLSEAVNRFSASLSR